MNTNDEIAERVLEIRRLERKRDRLKGADPSQGDPLGVSESCACRRYALNRLLDDIIDTEEKAASEAGAKERQRGEKDDA